MKFLIALLMLVLSFVASADSKTFVYDGSQSSIQLDLRSEKTHTEYRWENRHDICYRQDVFYRTVCHNTPRGPVCQTIPEYRTVSYPCIRSVQVPYQVHDYYVDAQVNLSVEVVGQAVPSGERITATLNGDTLTLSGKSGTNLIVIKGQNVNSQMQGGVKYIDADYTVELITAAPIVKSMSVNNLSIKNGIFNFSMGPVEAREHLGFSFDVKKNPVVGSSTSLFNRELTADEIVLTPGRAQIDTKKLGIVIKGGRHTLTPRVFFNRLGAVLNASEFQLEASKTLIYKVK